MLAVLVIIGAVFFAFCFKGTNQVLEITDLMSGKIYDRWPLEDGGTFAIEFIHSVNNSPVRETFIADRGEIHLYGLRFYSFGAGLPTPGDLEEGLQLTYDGDAGQPGAALIFTGFTASFRELNYIVGTVSDHLLFVNDEIVSLRDLCGLNAQITIRLRQEKINDCRKRFNSGTRNGSFQRRN